VTIDLVARPGGGPLGDEDYRQTLAAARRAEELGYDEVWLAEHHFTQDGYCPSLLPLAAAILAQSSRLRVGTYTLLLPLHHPVRVAEDVMVLDLLSGGRFDCGVGMGYRPEEYRGLGLDPRTRVSRMDECCDLLLRSWTDRNWSYAGRHFRLDNVDVHPRPGLRPPPTLWVGARTARSAARAARLAASLLLPPPSFCEDEEVVYAAYATHLRQAGQRPEDSERFRVARYVVPVVTDDPAAYRRQARIRVQARKQAFEAWQRESLDVGTAVAPASGGRRPSAIVGSADYCRRELASLTAGSIPVTDLILGLDSDADVERFARDVLPALH
jgi:alkanesulfonate monooxygenase SsuD/methylene tetrahydromethanopterin reductase-like flavin-dependent oxidoreductase (luciferase family)